MPYVDGTVIAVPTANKDAYIAHAREAAEMIKGYGATKVIENWGDDIPHGKLTDFHRAVQATTEESIVFSWITWPDKATRDAAWPKMMEDPRMKQLTMPFDGKRMIFGGFQEVLEA